MNSLFKLGVVFIAITALVSLALLDVGQVSIVWQGWVIESTLSFIIAAFISIFALLYVGIRLIYHLIYFPTWLRGRNELRQYARAESLMAKGMLALEVGDWKTAEKQLIKTAHRSQTGLVHYLNAAKMANQQGADKRRNQYLDEARKRFPADYVMIGLVESRLLLEKQPDVSETILMALYEQMPLDSVVLAQYAQVLKQQGNWAVLEGLLPRIAQTKALPRAQITQLEQQVLIKRLGKASDIDALDACWQQFPARVRKDAEILAEYVSIRIKWGEEVNLASYIEKAIAKKWNDRLAYLYGHLTLGPAYERVKKAQKWLNSQPNNPVLLLTLGRLSCQSQIWGQGQRYLKESIANQPEVETFHALAECYEAEGDDTKAALIYKEAILKLDERVLPPR